MIQIIKRGYETVKEYSDYNVAKKYLDDVCNWKS